MSWQEKGDGGRTQAGLQRDASVKELGPSLGRVWGEMPWRWWSGLAKGEERGKFGFGNNSRRPVAHPKLRRLSSYQTDAPQKTPRQVLMSDQDKALRGQRVNCLSHTHHHPSPFASLRFMMPYIALSSWVIVTQIDMTITGGHHIGLDRVHAFVAASPP
ncbi:hypothetical protein GQ53DRAFT_749808 [Thozetella sp. PMI_491]|nr:hypothetical protein GQ53DRAFT_749808 [Thozetella sp. PMI_491]